MLQAMWQASLWPKRLFLRLEEEEPRPFTALGVTLLAYLPGAFLVSLALLRLTRSDALPVFVSVGLFALFHLLFMWGWTAFS